MDNTDDNFVFTPSTTWDQVLKRCHSELYSWPPLLERKFYDSPLKRDSNTWELIGLGREIDASPSANGYSFRLLQWNVLAEALSKDAFDSSLNKALQWKQRRWRILEEIATVQPDIMCFQEVDHFKFLKTTLESLGFRGVFLPKPDSPCLKYDGNNGPDGCAMFWNERMWKPTSISERILEMNGCKTNQVALMTILERKRNLRCDDNAGDSGKKIAVVTTHLKAGQEQSSVSKRLEQGKDLLEWIRHQIPDGCPLVITGDFNAEPREPVYGVVLTNSDFQLSSSYAAEGHSVPDKTATGSDETTETGHVNIEPPRTAALIRKEGEESHAIDFIFYSKTSLVVEKILNFPANIAIPSYQYPSDHFSLVTDFSPVVNV